MVVTRNMKIERGLEIQRACPVSYTLQRHLMNLSIWTKILKARVGGAFRAYGSMKRLMTTIEKCESILASINRDSQARIPQ
jgi:hypothetical protein